jgi:hypothetical protein
MISEISQPTTMVPTITPAQISSTRRCSSSMRCLVSDSGAPRAIDAPATENVRTRYSTPPIVVLA